MIKVKITLKILNNFGLTVKPNLNHSISSFIYTHIDEALSKKFHDVSDIKPFTFSKIIFDKYLFRPDHNIDVLSDSAHFIISSINDELIKSFCEHVVYEKFYEIDNIIFTISNIESFTAKVIGEQFHIKMKEPICINCKEIINNKTNEKYPDPSDPRFINALISNINRKCQSSLVINDIEIIQSTMKKKKISYTKNGDIIGYMGEFKINCSEEVINYLFYNGIGVKNSCGFGLFEIINNK